MKMMFLNTEKLNKDEKRRLLLNKKYEKENNTLAAPSGAAEGVLTYTKKRLYAIIAVVVALAVIGSTLVVFVGKAASTKEMIPFDEQTHTYVITDGNKYKEGGTYYYEYDNRVYTYVFTEDLPAGTTLTFDPNNKNISWGTNNTYGRTDITSVSGVTVDTQNTDATHATLNLDRADLSKDTEYYYDLGNGSYYVFQLTNDLDGSISQTVRNTANTEVQYTTGTLVLDFDNKTADIDGTRFNMHYLYIQADTFANNSSSVYLIGVKNTANDATENIIAYDNATSSSIAQTDYQTPEGTLGAYTTKSLTAYGYNNNQFFYNTAPLAGESFTNNAPYYDGGEILTSTSNGSSQYLMGELNAVRSTDPANHYYLKPVNHTTYAYYDNRAFGHIYTSADPANLYVHEYSTYQSRFNSGSWYSPNYSYHNNKYGSNWTYDSSTHELVNANDSRDSNYKYLKYNSADSTKRYQLTQNSGDYVTLYKMEMVPIPDDYANTGSGDTYTNHPGAVAPTNVSYTDNLTVEDNYLELDKTVTPTSQDNNTYKVHLEAYTTNKTIKQPVTDVVMVMDTSNKMDNALYTRDYRNLNTYTKFSAVSLADRIHDDLFDGDMNDEDQGLMLQIVNWVVGGASSAIFDNRNYIGNRYVEDPNYPGTYVYLYQKYRQEGTIAGQLLYLTTFGVAGSPMKNYYQYYFTSANGEEYATNEISENLTDTASYLVNRSSGAINSLTFYKDGNTSNEPLPISAIYKRDGTNKDNALNRSTGSDKFDNTGLYEISNSTGGLYIRDNDGEYKRVRVTPVDKDLNPTTADSAVLYRYTVDGTDYVMYQGASQGGIQDNIHHPEYYGVYQGFRYYKPDPDDPNKLIIDEERSLLSKTLYTEDEGTTVTRLQALKEASEEFLLNVYKQSQTAEINVGIVKYDAGATTLYKLGYLSDDTPADLSNANHIDQMISDVYNLAANTSSKASTIDDGMANAQTEFEQRSPEGNRRFLLLFSGGVPADYTTIWIFTTIDTSSGDYDTTVASNAISTAYTLKNDMNTTIYSVGLFENADEAEESTYGHKYFYGFFNPTDCNNEIGNSWGRTGTANIISSFTGLSIDPMDAAATNRMLGYISSDYSTPQNVGLKRYAGGLGFWNRTNPGLDYYGNLYYIFSTGGAGYKISNRYSKTDSNHYFGISPATVTESEGDDEEGSSIDIIPIDAATIRERFKTVFDTIIAETSVPSNILDERAKLLDGITEYFKLKPETVEGYMLSTTDNGTTWPPSTKDTSTVTVSAYPDTGAAITADTKTLIATNHSYKDWYVNPNTGEGKKIVLEFEIERIPDLIGGNNIPTNLNNSGIYDGNPLNNPVLGTLGVLEEKFEVPKVDLSIIDIDTIGQNQSAYYGCEADLQDMVNPKWVNGKNNEFVNMEYKFYDPSGNLVSTYTVPAGYTEGTWDPEIDSVENTTKRFVQMFETSEYTVELKVTPSTSGTVPYRDDFDPGEAMVYVYTPHYDVHNDTVEEAGDPYNLTTIPELGDWELDMTGITTEDEDELADIKAEADHLLAFKQEPEVAYGLENITSNTNPVTDQNKTAYPIPEKTVFQMINIEVTPTPVPYLAKNVVTGYTLYSGSGDNRRVVGVQSLDADGNVVSTVWYDSDGNVTETAQSYDDSEEIRGDVTRYVYRNAVDATNKTSVTNTDDHNTDKQFTIGLPSHDVTITNHTVKSEDAEADYSDRTKAFPLTITLKDGNNPVVGEEIHYTDPSGNPQTATTDENGQFVINLKHEETVTLAEVRDGYTLTVTSDPSDAYHVGYKYAEGDGALGPAQNVDIQTESATFTVSDDLRIDVTHSIDDIPITGYPDKSSMFNPFLILAAMLTIGGGAYGGYTYKRKKETELAAYQAGKSE